MKLKAYQDKYKNSELIPGWEAIANKLEEVYQKQEPKHYNPEVPFIIRFSCYKVLGCFFR